MTDEKAKEVLQEQIDKYGQEYDAEGIEALEIAIKRLEQTELNPSYNGVKSELKPCEDCISRKEALRHRHIIYNDDGVGYSVVRVDEIEQLPSVTPQQPCEEENPNCTECRYYDHEKHHCPRFCRVIENTIAEITSEQTRWIPVSKELPPIAQRVWVSATNGEVFIARYHSFDKWTFEPTGISYAYNKDSIVAWMPLPQPYKAESEEEE